jgi:hypothetical protein
MRQIEAPAHFLANLEERTNISRHNSTVARQSPRIPEA